MKDEEKIIKIDEDKTNVEIDIAEYPADLAYLELEEELTEKRISYIERQIRNSYEYRQYINYLKTELDLTKCALLPNLDSNELSISLEFHHFPLNLYEITEAVAKKMLSELNDGEKISCFDISEAVTAEHYKNNIGLVPLTETLHKMAHNKAIIIPIDKVNGNYKNFISKYGDFIEPDILDRISDIEISSITEDAKNYNNIKLKKNIINYDIKYYKEDSDSE